MLLIELIIFTKTFSYARGTSCLKSTVTLIWSLRSEVEVVLILHLPLFVVCSSVSYQILPMLSLLATIACTQIFGLNLCRKLFPVPEKTSPVAPESPISAVPIGLFASSDRELI